MNSRRPWAVGMHELYFAYGSNMNSARMAARVRCAEKVGTGRVIGRVVAERLYADLVHNHRGVADGVLWKLPPGGLNILDRYEGVPSVYRRTTVYVSTKNGIVAATTYEMTDAAKRERSGVPYPAWYREVCSLGARENGIADAFAA